MNPFEMVAVIVVAVMIASVLRARYGYHRRGGADGAIPAEERAETLRLRDEVKELKERDYILTLPDSTFPDDEEYAFKHNLERETLLKLLPRAQAKRFHKAIADWLSFKPHVRTHEEYMGMLARHQEKAGLVVQSAATYLDAADLARERYANTKSAEYYVKGLTLLRDGAEGFLFCTFSGVSAAVRAWKHRELTHKQMTHGSPASLGASSRLIRLLAPPWPPLRPGRMP